jgi:hypothetical protein
VEVLEVVMRDQMIRFIDENRLLSPNQSGFCTGHSTIMALFKITNGIAVALVGFFLSDRYQCVSVDGILLELMVMCWDPYSSKLFSLSDDPCAASMNVFVV